MEQTQAKTDPFIESLESLLENLDHDAPEIDPIPDLPTREDILNIHLAAIKTILLLE